MGNVQNIKKINHGIQQFIQQEFQRVLKNKNKDYLTISEVLEIKHPEDYPFNFSHIGILYICDHNLDSIYTVEDFRYFTLWIQQRLQGVQMYEFKAQLQAETMHYFIQQIINNSAEKRIIDWFIQLLVKDNKFLKLHSTTYIRIQQLKILYEVFNVKMMNDMDIQSFFYLIKKASEEMNYKIEEFLQQQEQQQYIAVPACEEFIKGFLKGVRKIIHEIGYDKNLQ